jgi:uncharacterized protein
MNKIMFKLGLLAAFIGLSSFLYVTNETIPEQKSLLWKIEGNGLKKASYLFGTMHLIEKEYFYFPKSLEKFITKSDVVVMEIADLNQAEAMKYFILKEGTLFDYFNEAQQDSLLTWVKTNAGMDEAMFRSTFEKMKPFVVLQTVTQLQFIGKTESYEKTISDIATNKKIKTLGLETIADQMGIFDDMTKEQQTEMVMEGIRNGDSSNDEMVIMQKLYRKQYLDSLYAYVASKESVLMDSDAFLKNRNHNWIPKIKDIIKDQAAFIAVGAAHLGGMDGVIELLKKEGYTVTPVKF